jgi:hypothetical protein
MRVLVVYESMFGNTEAVARAVADGLAGSSAPEPVDVDVREVSGAPSPVAGQWDLVVAGGPTHAFSLSRPSTRAEAHSRGATRGSDDVGLREWLEKLARGPHAERLAAFDTRVEKVRHLPGSAAKSAVKALRRHGYSAAVKQESFFVLDTSGPLVEGELERAYAWGAHLGQVALAHVHEADHPSPTGRQM